MGSVAWPRARLALAGLEVATEGVADQIRVRSPLVRGPLVQSLAQLGIEPHRLDRRRRRAHRRPSTSAPQNLIDVETLFSLGDPALQKLIGERPLPNLPSGKPNDIATRFPIEPGTCPAHWDGSPLLAAELTPPAREHTAPTTLHFGTHLRPETVAKRLARTLFCQFQQERDIWVTSTPDLITITPEPAGGSLITIELTTRPHHLTTTLGAIGLTPITGPPPRAPTADD